MTYDSPTSPPALVGGRLFLLFKYFFVSHDRGTPLPPLLKFFCFQPSVFQVIPPIFYEMCLFAQRVSPTCPRNTTPRCLRTVVSSGDLPFLSIPPPVSPRSCFFFLEFAFRSFSAQSPCTFSSRLVPPPPYVSL